MIVEDNPAPDSIRGLDERGAGSKDGAPTGKAPAQGRGRVNFLRRTLLGTIVATAITVFILDRWVAATDIPSLSPPVSATVLDRDGALLRAYQVESGLWRLPVSVGDVDRDYIALLLAYEDKRFFSHGGVDLRAMLRAAWSSAWAGRIVSGGSTITMQVARLLEDAPTRSMRAKLRQVRLALALERRLGKDAILDLYLTLAPFGGNIEGVRAAALTWFGKEPGRLTPAQGALLVALPQSPEGRRPDRHAGRAKAARDRVLARAVGAGALPPGDARAARTEAVPTARRGFPQHAAHLADRVKVTSEAVRTTLDATVQAELETLLRERARALGPAVSAAVIVANHGTGEIVARVGSSDLMDARRKGFVDMSRAVRSPGSTLKPLIFGLAFEQGLAHPETLIDDRPMVFGRYAPLNFDRQWYGTVSVRKALHLSLNIPAVAALEGVGPSRLVARMRRAGARPVLQDAPGLAIALGGLGMTLHDLVQVYAAIARGGEGVVLREVAAITAEQERAFGAPHPRSLPVKDGEGGEISGASAPVLSAEAAWQVGDILAGAPVPGAAARETLAFKTGTSYGHRDAWAVGFDGRHVIGVWLGRPDGAPSPGILGLETAAPVLFEAFARVKARPDPLPPAPRSVLRLPNSELPQPLRRFRTRSAPVARDVAPAIAFPPDGATLAWETGDPLALKVGGGAPPFRWLVDGAPLSADPFARQVSMIPGGPGFVSIAVIDASGKAARARIRVE